MKQDKSSKAGDIINDEQPDHPKGLSFKRDSYSPPARPSSNKHSTGVPTAVVGETAIDAASLPHEIDKLVLVLPRDLMTDFELAEAGERIKAIDKVKYRTSKSDSYLHKYVLTCPGGAKVTFALMAADPRMHFCVKITLNPSRMKDKIDAKAFDHCLKQLFLPSWKTYLAAMLLQRVDHAFDVQCPRAGLIVQQKGSPSESKYFVQTDRQGNIQTWYCGSIESRVHWVTYDQDASDDYKIAHGELPARPKARDDAELIFEKSKIMGMTRFESRRVFGKPMTLREADAEKDPLGHFVVYLINEAKLAAAPADFALFLDSVRLRGVAGAGKQYLDHYPTREGKKRLARLNEYLATCIAPWWDKSGLLSSIELALKDQQIWNVLKYLAD